MTKIPGPPLPREAAPNAAPGSAPAARPARGALLRRLHRLSAIVVAAYVFPHLVNHVLALGGIERHLAFMALVRGVVRTPAVETLLLLCVAIQVVSGCILLLRARRTAGPLRTPLRRREQRLSGAYVAMFLAIHVGAVLNARLRLGLDTNFYFAAAGLQAAPWRLFFAPYYAAAIVALGTHLACAWRLGRVPAVATVAGSAVLAAVIVATFSGALYPVTIPPPYMAALRAAAP